MTVAASRSNSRAKDSAHNAQVPQDCHALPYTLQAPCIVHSKAYVLAWVLQNCIPMPSDVRTSHSSILPHDGTSFDALTIQTRLDWVDSRRGC